jgi:hypothetical protein
MQVETYEIEEHTETDTAATIADLETGALELIEKLALEGQKELVVPHEETNRETRIPYPKMTAQERAVYRAIFPTTTPVCKYNAGILPVRVMQVFEHARGLFRLVEVWHAPVTHPDPIMIGCQEAHSHSSENIFLLARWGNALKPFAELIEEARAAIKLQFSEEIAAKIARAQENLAKIDVLVAQKVRGEYVWV